MSLQWEERVWTYVCVHMCCKTIMAPCGDRGSLSRDFPLPRSIISQTTGRETRHTRLKHTRRWPSHLRWTAGNEHWHIHTSHVALNCLVPTIPSSCPFLPLSFLSSPTSPAAFLTCLRETEGASRAGKQRHTRHTTHSQWHWLQPLSVCTEEKVLVLACQKEHQFSSSKHTHPGSVLFGDRSDCA